MNIFILFLNLRKALLIPAERRVDIALNYMFNREKFCHAVFFVAVIGSALCVCVFSRPGRDVLGNVEVMQLDFEMENFTSLSVTRRINWNIDYKGQNPPPDSEKVVTELTVVQRDIQAIIPLAMVSGED